MTAPPDIPPQLGAPPPEAALEGVRKKDIQGRSLGRIAWTRLKRDKVAMGGGIVVLLIILAAIFAPVLVDWFGHPPNEFHQEHTDPELGTVNLSWGGLFSSEYLLGLEPGNGRDLFSRILYGAQTSLLIGFLATMVSVVIGVFMGVVSGYFGGWVDALISRTMDLFLAFPLILFAIALVGVQPDEMFGLSGNALRKAILVFIIGFFSWPYIGRIVRGQTLSLRNREFVDAARSLGARHPYILFKELLPNLVAPIVVYATLMIPTNILFEAGLSFVGVGITPPEPSWGGMLDDATRLYAIAPHFVMIPGLAIFITVLAFNIFGDGLRDALDPKAR